MLGELFPSPALPGSGSMGMFSARNSTPKLTQKSLFILLCQTFSPFSEVKYKSLLILLLEKDVHELRL